MQKVSLYVDANLWKRLGEISRRTMIPKAALLRKAIEKIIKEYAQKK
jgi:predicted DNA-binding protein